MKDKALKLALEAFEWNYNTDLDNIPACEKWAKMLKENITAIKEALAQPEQEPVAVKHMMEWVDYLKRKSDYGQHMRIPSEMSAGACWELAIELEQFINTTPPQRKPLSDEQIGEIGRKYEKFDNQGNEFFARWGFARAIEAAHGIKE